VLPGLSPGFDELVFRFSWPSEPVPAASRKADKVAQGVASSAPGRTLEPPARSGPAFDSASQRRRQRASDSSPDGAWRSRCRGSRNPGRDPRLSCVPGGGPAPARTRGNVLNGRCLQDRGEPIARTTGLFIGCRFELPGGTPGGSAAAAHRAAFSVNVNRGEPRRAVGDGSPSRASRKPRGSARWSCPHPRSRQLSATLSRLGRRAGRRLLLRSVRGPSPRLGRRRSRSIRRQVRASLRRPGRSPGHRGFALPRRFHLCYTATRGCSHNGFVQSSRRGWTSNHARSGAARQAATIAIPGAPRGGVTPLETGRPGPVTLLGAAPSSRGRGGPELLLGQEVPLDGQARREAIATMSKATALPSATGHGPVL